MNNTLTFDLIKEPNYIMNIKTFFAKAFWGLAISSSSIALNFYILTEGADVELHDWN